MQGRKLKSEAWTSLDSTIENSKKKIWFYSKNKFFFIANLLIKQDRKPTFGVLTTYESTRQIQEEENIANHQPDQMLISNANHIFIFRLKKPCRPIGELIYCQMMTLIYRKCCCAQGCSQQHQAWARGKAQIPPHL